MDDWTPLDDFLQTAGMAPRLDISGYPKEQADAIERYVERARNIVTVALPHFPGLSGVQVTCVEDSTFNAWATKCEGKYFVGIHLGLLTILTSVVFRMLADARTFRDIGDPDLETDDLPLFSKITPDAYDCDLIPTHPNSEHRGIYATHLCNTVFDFIIAHELTHIGHGHVDYMLHESGMPFISERSGLATAPSRNIERQAMEMDADFTAAEVLVYNVRRLIKMADQLGIELATRYVDPNPAMFDLAAAISIQSRLFGDARLSLADLATLDHPPDRWRQLMVLNAMGNHVDQLWEGKFTAPAMSAISRAIEEVEEAFERMTGQPQQVQGLHDVWHGEGWAYAAAVCDCWNRTLRPKLADHSFTALVTYGFDSAPTDPK